MLKVSVILTTYNSEKTLQRALDSVFKQKGLNISFIFEWLVVDDCSTDDTHDILTQNSIPFLKTKQNSGGPNVGRNTALKVSTGDYICFIDHDDEWLPEKTQKQLAHADKGEIITCGYITQNSTNSQIVNNYEDNCSLQYKYFEKNETFLKKLSKEKTSQRTYFGSIMIRKELKNTYFEEKYGMVDFDWILRIFEERDSIEICEPLFIRYVDGPNLSLNEIYRLNDFEYSLHFIEKYQTKYPKLVEMGKKRMYGSIARYYYLVNNMKESRKYFLYSDLNIKNILYFLTTFLGSSFVRKRFNVFG